MTEQIMKPKMPKEPITKKVFVEIEARLSRDHDRYSTSTILMSAAHATFTLPDGSTGDVYTSMGGNEVEVRFGQRTWRVNICGLVEAALEADKLYLQTM